MSDHCDSDGLTIQDDYPKRIVLSAKAMGKFIDVPNWDYLVNKDVIL